MAIPTTTYLDLWLIPDGSTPTPDWGALLNQNFQQIDALLGVPVTPGGTPGIDINADLPFNGNFATSLGGETLNVQSAPLASSYTNTLYDYNGQLWWNDNAGNASQVSGVSGVNSGFSGLPSGTAKAQFAFPAFLFYQSTNVYAQLVTGRLTVYDDTNPSPAHGISILSPASLAAAYSLTLPAALPGNAAFWTTNAAGVTGFVQPDNASIYFSGTVQVKPLGIQTGMIAANAVTAAKIANNTITTAQIANPLAQVGSVVTPTPLTNWAAATTPTYWIDVNGIVRLQGSVTVTNTGGSLAIFQFNSGFRPVAPRLFTCAVYGSANGNCSLNVDTGGNLTVYWIGALINGAALAFDGIAFSTVI